MASGFFRPKNPVKDISLLSFNLGVQWSAGRK